MTPMRLQTGGRDRASPASFLVTAERQTYRLTDGLIMKETETDLVTLIQTFDDCITNKTTNYLIN